MRRVPRLFLWVSDAFQTSDDQALDEKAKYSKAQGEEQDEGAEAAGAGLLRKIPDDEGHEQHRPPTSKVIISSSKNSGSILASAAVHQGASLVLAARHNKVVDITALLASRGNCSMVLEPVHDLSCA